MLLVRDPIQRLCRFLDERRHGAFEPHDAAYVVKTAAREILPVCGFSGLCSQIDLFADWLVHSELDRAPAGQRAIATIAEAIPLHGRDGRDEKWLEETVNACVSFANLRLELVAVCREFRFPEEPFASWELWQQFALPLSFEVSGRAIRVGSDQRAARQARARIAAASIHHSHRPARITLCLDGADKRWWRIQTEGDINILVQVLFGGFRLDDFPTPRGWRSPLAVADAAT